MRKDKLFIEAMKAKRYKSKKWVISAFSVVRQIPTNEKAENYEIVNDGVRWSFYDESSNSFLPIEDEKGNVITNVKEPIFKFTDQIVIESLDALNLISGKSIATTYGILLANYILLIYPFGDKIPYLNEEFKIGKIESKIGELLVDDDVEDPSKIPVREYKEFVKACGQLEGLAQLCVPTATEKSLTTDPKVKEVVAQLKEQYKGQLNNPLVIAKIDAEVEKMDRAWLKGDPAERFYLKDKAYAVTRKKMYGLYGGEAGLGDGSSMDFIDKPLSEGLDTEKLPAMINSLRSGSYDRGTQTALGGVAVKQFFRVFQNSNITTNDCGSTNGILRNIRKDNYKRFIGFYHLVNKKPEMITEDNVKELIGKQIEMRSPAACKIPFTDYCEVCMGSENSRNKTGLGASASEIGSRFMILFLKSMHGKSLKTANLDIKTAIY